jgi:ABC-type Zn uptake system ZnuABC Zn-binding protein ZnuA
VHRRPLRIAALLALAAGPLLAGCGSGASTAGGSTAQAASALDVVATTPVVADFVRNVGGDRVTVTQILKPGVDPHDYEAAPADVQAIAGAALVVKSGVGLEHWLDDTIDSAGYSGQVVDTSKGVAIRQGNGDEEQAQGDPHIWHDPRNAKIMVRNIADALEAKDPADKAEYERNATAYSAKLDALDVADQAKISTIPAAQRKLVTNHDAFGYYCARYGITFVGSIIPSFDTSAELSGKGLTDLVATIKQTGVRAVFSESSLPPKTAETVAKEAGVQVVEGEDSLYADGLGPAGSPGGTYLGAEQHNTDTIVKALGGRV